MILTHIYFAGMIASSPHNSSISRDMTDSDWVKKVFIIPDLTPKEQEQSKELRKQLAELNSSGKK